MPTDCPEFSSWVAGLSLTNADKQKLTNGEWLLASHISAAQKLMKSQFPSQNGLADTCALKQKSVWPSCSDNFVQIIHVSPGHWGCLSNKFSSDGNVDLYDSLHTYPKEDGTIVPQVCLILQCLESEVTIRVVNVGRQQGFDDCGLFAVAMAYDLCRGVDPATKLYVQNQMRSHLYFCFTVEQLCPFPSVSIDITKRVICNFTVNVYCICRMPEQSKLMVCCDLCQEWFHEGCVPVSQEILENESNEVPWLCPRCSNGIYSVKISLQVYICMLHNLIHVTFVQTLILLLMVVH